MKVKITKGFFSKTLSMEDALALAVEEFGEGLTLEEYFAKFKEIYADATVELIPE